MNYQLIYFTLPKITLMADTKQISATINLELADEVQALAISEKRSFSQLVEMLLMEALVVRSNTKIRESKKEKIK